jgi:hypothetical protein
VMYGNAKARTITMAYMMRVLFIVYAPIFLEDEMQARE